MSFPGLEHGERSEVLITDENGDEEYVEVFDHVSVEIPVYVGSVNGYRQYEADIGAGDMGANAQTPEAVTKRVSVMLWDEFSIRVEDIGVRVVDMTQDNVQEM